MLIKRSTAIHYWQYLTNKLSSKNLLKTSDKALIVHLQIGSKSSWRNTQLLYRSHLALKNKGICVQTDTIALAIWRRWNLRWIKADWGWLYWQTNRDTFTDYEMFIHICSWHLAWMGSIFFLYFNSYSKHSQLIIGSMVWCCQNYRIHKTWQRINTAILIDIIAFQIVKKKNLICSLKVKRIVEKDLHFSGGAFWVTKQG